MKTKKRLMRAIGLTLALGLAVPAFADAQADDLTKALNKDQAAQCYLGVDQTPKFDTYKTFKADLNGDGIKDSVALGYVNKRALVAMATYDKEGKATYRGFSPIDSAKTPRIKVKDLTGNGKAEVHVISSKGEDKVLTLVGLRGEKTTRLFRDYLVCYRRDALEKYKVTKLVSFVDTNQDGVREISVSERRTELVTIKGKEVEISGSSVASQATYVSGSNGFALASEKRGKLTPAAKLAIASALIDAGDHLRAKNNLDELLGTKGLDDQLAISGMALISKITKEIKLVGETGKAAVKA